MRAAFYKKQEAARGTCCRRLARSTARAGEVRVRVAASGINPSDIKDKNRLRRQGMPFGRIVPHQDGAGVIDASPRRC